MRTAAAASLLVLAGALAVGGARSQDEPRTAWLAQLASSLAAWREPALRPSACDAAPAGIRCAVGADRSQLEVVFDPALDAGSVARALGLTRPIAVSVDRHGEHLLLHDRWTPRVALLPRLGAWEVRATVTDARDTPTVLDIPGGARLVGAIDRRARVAGLSVNRALPPAAAVESIGEAVVGVWHALPDVGSGYGALLVVRADGTWESRPAEPETGCAPASAHGVWAAIGRELALREQRRSAVQGCPVGRAPATTTTLRLSRCAAADGARGAGSCVRFGGRPWWRIASDEGGLE